MTNVILQKGDFMKKQLTVALGLAVLATPAFATKARLQALGEDVNGSYYVNDNRNNNPNNRVSMDSNMADNIPNTKESSIEHNTVYTCRLLLATFELEQ